MPIHQRCQHPWQNLQVSASTLGVLRAMRLCLSVMSYLLIIIVFDYRGVVISTKMKNNVVIRRDYLHYIKKYNRFEKRHKTVAAHCSPAFRIKVGDVVTVGQCRPLSKTVRFNVIRKEVQHIEGNVKKVFVLF